MRIRSQIHLVVLVFLGFLCSTTNGWAAEPSFAETTAWLVDRLPGLVIGDDSYNSISFTIHYTFAGCIMHVRNKQISTESPDHEAETTAFYVVEMEPLPSKEFEAREGPLVKLPSSPRAGISAIMNDSINFKNVDLSSIKVKTVHLDPNQPESSAYALATFAPKVVMIATTDQRLAHQLARALSRAASLCGATGSPF